MSNDQSGQNPASGQASLSLFSDAIFAPMKRAPCESWAEPVFTGALVLADGTVLRGYGLGATGQAVGERRHLTAMVPFRPGGRAGYPAGATATDRQALRRKHRKNLDPRNRPRLHLAAIPAAPPADRRHRGGASLERRDRSGQTRLAADLGEFPPARMGRLALASLRGGPAGSGRGAASIGMARGEIHLRG